MTTTKSRRGPELPHAGDRSLRPPGASGIPAWRVIVWGVPGWLIFGAVWWKGITDQNDQLIQGAILWAGFLVFWLIVIFWWVFHNRRLARRKEAERGPRSTPAGMELVIDEDALGRPLDRPDDATSARHLVVDVTNGRKHFRNADRP